MSQPMNNAKEIVEKISKTETGNEKLKTIDRLITQNQGKIWLRTRSGKPMAAKMEETAAMVWEKHEKGEDINAVLDTLLAVAKEIDDESQRRSMVVT